MHRIDQYRHRFGVSMLRNPVAEVENVARIGPVLTERLQQAAYFGPNLIVPGE